jgi:calcium-dependent protein kinase
MAEVKLIDFGLSKVYGDNHELTEGVGTIYTMAPEVLKGNYTAQADIWSVGVIAYMLLSSQMPFYGRKRRHIVEQILNCQFDFRGRRWKRISDQAKAFVEDLLVLDPEDRLDAQSAMSCSWLNKRFAATSRAPHIEEESMARDAMLRYSGYTKLKKVVRNVFFAGRIYVCLVVLVLFY